LRDLFRGREVIQLNIDGLAAGGDTTATALAARPSPLTSDPSTPRIGGSGDGAAPASIKIATTLAIKAHPPRAKLRAAPQAT